MILELLRDDYTFEEAEKIQAKYANLIKKKPKIIDQKIYLRNIKVLMGVDISYFTIENGEYGVACAIL